MEYEAIIGMEVHAQVLTRSKMFCACSSEYASAPPNTHTCPVCLALPGVLPAINRVAVEATVLTGLALNCAIPPFSKFDRKNYTYPDLPKGYQISQYDYPFCVNGYLDVTVADVETRIRIRRVHLEEDTAKLTHAEGGSLIDFNRAGVPLMEIVTEADIRSAEEAHAYLTKLRAILRYLGVSTADMEKGAMRCEANIRCGPAAPRLFVSKASAKSQLISVGGAAPPITRSRGRLTCWMRASALPRSPWAGMKSDSAPSFSAPKSHPTTIATFLNPICRRWSSPRTCWPTCASGCPSCPMPKRNVLSAN